MLTPWARSVCQHRLVEMQAGGGRGDGARCAGIDGLVARFVGAFGRVLDVGRQRQLAVLLGQFPAGCRGRPSPGQRIRRRLRPARYDDLEGIGQLQPRARLGRLAGADLRDRVRRVDDALEQHLDLAAAFLDAEEARLDHARVVEHQQVAGCEQVRQIGEMPIADAGGRTTCSRRLPVRSAAGCWAISSGGRGSRSR